MIVYSDQEIVNVFNSHFNDFVKNLIIQPFESSLSRSRSIKK